MLLKLPRCRSIAVWLGSDFVSTPFALKPQLLSTGSTRSYIHPKMSSFSRQENNKLHLLLLYEQANSYTTS